MKLFDTAKALRLVAISLMAVIPLFLISCSDNGTVGADFSAPLELSGVRWQSPDSTGQPQELNPGDLIALEGRNMNTVARVYFNGIEAEFNPALASERYLIVGVPGNLPFGELDPNAETFNTIRVTNNSSEAQMDFPVLPPAPELQAMSNEHAFPGDEVTLYGNFLYLIESITLPDGVEVSGADVEAAADGSSVTFTLPQNVSTDVNGTISITTVAGSDDSDPAFTFHGYQGVVLDMLNASNPAAPAVHGGPQVEQWAWWSAIHPYSSGDVYMTSAQDFVSGAEGDFVIVQQGDGRDAIASNDNAWWGSYRSINLNGSTQWVAPENLDEPPGNFAVKFEMAVHGEWSTGTFQIILPETNYAARVEPWRNEQGANTVVAYDGWRTYTVPLSTFMANGGTGATATDLVALLGTDGVANATDNSPAFRFINDTPGDVPAGVAFAIDKVRIVRIGESQ